MAENHSGVAPDFLRSTLGTISKLRERHPGKPGRGILSRSPAVKMESEGTRPGDGREAANLRDFPASSAPRLELSASSYRTTVKIKNRTMPEESARWYGSGTLAGFRVARLLRWCETGDLDHRVRLAMPVTTAHVLTSPKLLDDN